MDPGDRQDGARRRSRTPKMRTLRFPLLAPLFTSLGALALAAAASAQFDGPAPLAWRWVQPTNAAASGSPLVKGDTIYTAIGSRVYALDLTTGNKKWQYPPVEPADGQFRTAPIFAGNVLVAASDNKVVYAVDPNTGAAKWSYTSPSPVFGSPVAVGDNYVAFATSDNTLIALDATTGKPIWTAPYRIFDRLQGQISSYGNGIVFFNGLNELRSLDVVSQKAAYRRPIRFSVLPPGATPVLYGSTFYVSSGPYLVAINAADGTTKWQTDTRLQLAFSPAPSANGVLVVSEDGEALVLDPTNGRPMGSTKSAPVKLGSFPAQRPSVAGTKFLVPTSNGSINLFDPTTGALLWSYVIRPIGDVYENAGVSGNANGRGPGGPGGPGGGQTTGKLITSLIASGPAVLAGQTLLVPAKDGSLLAFDRDLGVDLTPPTVKQLWPNPGDVVSGRSPLELIFRLSDEAAGVNEKTIKVEIDGEEAGFTYTRDGYVRVAFTSVPPTTPFKPGAPVGAFLPGEVPKPNLQLQDGRHAVVVTATDWMGNVAKMTYSVVIDNALPPLPLPGGDKTGQNGPGGSGGQGGSGRGGGSGDGR